MQAKTFEADHQFKSPVSTACTQTMPRIEAEGDGPLRRGERALQRSNQSLAGCGGFHHHLTQNGITVKVPGALSDILSTRIEGVENQPRIMEQCLANRLWKSIGEFALTIHFRLASRFTPLAQRNGRPSHDG